MRSGKARPRLDGFVTKLRSWEATVPDRARRFHAVRVKLEMEIREAVPVWRLWIDDEVVERYRTRIDRLEEVAEPLVELIGEAKRLESEVSELSKRAAVADSELASWLEGRCREWLGILGRLGTNCERSSDVYRDHSVIGVIESNVRSHDEALQQLREAARLATELRANIRAAELIGRLPELHDRLYAHGATTEWLNDIKSLLQPLKPIADRIADPPAELYEVGEYLREARGWSKRLGGELANEIQDLGERHQFKAADWEDEPADGLVAEAAALRQRLVNRAQEVRSARLVEIEEQMNDLRQACGHQEDLQEKLTALQESTFDHPEGFRDWLSMVEQFRRSFTATAHADIGRIEYRLREAITELQSKLHDLEKRPLSDETARAAAALAYASRQLPDPSQASAEEMLGGLRKTKTIEQDIERLRRRAEQEVREIEEQRRALVTRSEALQTEAQRVKRVAIDLGDLPSRLAAADSPPAGSLTDRRRLLCDLEAELHAAETAFVASCGQELSRQMQSAQSAVDILRSAGVSAAPIEAMTIAAGASPHTAAQAVIDAARLFRRVAQKSRDSLADFKMRGERARVELARLRPDELTPGDRHSAGHLAQALGGVLGSTGGAPLLDRLARLAARVNETERFFAQLQQEEIRARAWLSELLQRLQGLHEEQLDRFCPELTERVAALLYGIPERPRQWSAVHHQLSVAGELFGRVEAQARRLAADELRRAAATLHQTARGAADPSFRASAQALLDELDACSSDELPDVSLRRRIVGAVQRQA
jgi:hypothetical protein